MDLINTKTGKQQLFYTYVTFLLNGVLALSLGSLLPYLKDDRGLSYAFAGVIVSLHSIGNFVSSFFSGTVSVAIGRKRCILLFNAAFFISYIMIIFGNSNWSLALAFFLTGIARGASSNFSNTVINNLAPGKASYLNILHAMFSIGALSFPVILTLLVKNNADGWVSALYMMAALGILCFILYLLNPIPEDLGMAKKGDEKNSEISNGYGFFKEPLFYLVSLTLFFYLSVEQGVIGWMVTYFKDTGLLNDTFSQLTNTIMWLMMLIGRLAVAYLSTRLKKDNMLICMGVGVTVFFFWLVFSRNTPMIVAGIVGFGLSMAGIYATTVSFAGKLLQKYSLCWSFILTLASLGSVLMPMLIGAIAERAGMFAGMSSVLVVVVIDFILIVFLRKYLRSGRAA